MKFAYQLYKDIDGEWRWRFVASNGAIIGVSSEGYVNKGDCKTSINLIKIESPEAQVIEKKNVKALFRRKRKRLNIK